MDIKLDYFQYFLITLTVQRSKLNLETLMPVQLHVGIVLRPKKISPYPLGNEHEPHHAVMTARIATRMG